MKKYLTGVSILALAFLAAACAHTDDRDHDHGDDPAHDHTPAHNHEKEQADSHEEGSDEIVITDAVAKRMGIEVAEIRPGDFNEVILTGGEILPSPGDRAMAVAPVAGTVKFSSAIMPGANVGAGSAIAQVSKGRVTGGDPDAAARAAIQAAKRELDRATPLRAEGIVSEKEYAALQAAYQAALAAYSPAAASGVATSPIGGVVTALLVNQGEYVEAGQPIAQISRTQRLTLRADLPLRHASRAAGIAGANIRPAGSDLTYQLAKLGGARTGGNAAETAGAYLPIYFSFNNPGGEAVPGAVVEVALLGAKRSGVIAVPVSALSEQMGEMYVYVKIDDHGYERRPVKTGASDGLRTEIVEGLSAGDVVVTKGTSAVRLAENSGKVPEGHNHNH